MVETMVLSLITGSILRSVAVCGVLVEVLRFLRGNAAQRGKFDTCIIFVPRNDRYGKNNSEYRFVSSTIDTIDKDTNIKILVS